MPLQTLYTASAVTSGGRNGHVESSDGTLDLDLSMPEGLGGPGEEGATNPEQLFAAGYSACFGQALRLVADRHGQDVGDSSIRANVDIGQTDDGGFGLAVELIGRLPGLAREEAQALGARPLREAVDALARRARLDLGAGAATSSVLTPREQEVMRLVAQGLTNRQIGRRLYISEKTASVHVSNVLAKLGAGGRAEAVAIAHRRGLLATVEPADAP